MTAGLTVGVTSVASAAPTRPASVPRPADGVVGLQLGSSGPAVTLVQRQLMKFGYVLRDGADGRFGAETDRAVRHFQRANGLLPNGVITGATARWLGLSNTATGASSIATPAPAPAAQAVPGSFAGLRQGSTGASVRALQSKLMSLGLYVRGGADGVYGVGTTAAVRAVQKVNRLPQTGVVDAATARVLGSPASAPAAPAAPVAPAPASQTPSTSASYAGLQPGSTGQAVRSLQAKLRSLGLAIYGDPDGTYGARTTAGVRAVQKVNRLPQTGVVDAATARMLGSPVPATAAPATPAPAAPAPGSAAGFATYDERGSRVVALQTALMNAGMTLRGGADGAFGSGTLAAIIAFQKAHGLPVTGQVNTATAQALGLSAMPKPSTPEYGAITLEARPVQGPCWYGDTWQAARNVGRTHLGVDIIAAEGRQLYAVFTGRVIQIYRDAPGSLSGNGVKIQRPDGTYAFYAHLSSIAPGIDVGVPVQAGQLIGYVGRTGNAGGPHLHLEIHPGGGSAVNPYPMVKATGAC